ncbi:MAG: DUF2207 family protein [Bacilli bacterium]
MKKFLFLVLVLIYGPFTVSAKVNDVDYDVEAMYVNADIQDDGDMLVKELIVLDGDFNGYERQLNFSNTLLNSNDKIDFEHDAIYNPGDIKLIKSSAKKLKKHSFSDVNGDFDDFREVEFDAIGKSDLYRQTKTNNQLIIRTYNSCYNCTVGFYFEYEVSQAVVMHEDVAELYYEFIGNAFDDSIDKVEIRVNLPEKDKSDNFRVWAHGNLQGEIDFNNKKDGVVATIENLKAKNTVDIRMTFAKDIIIYDKYLDHSNVEALPSILKVEEKRAEEANRQRKRIKTIYYSIQYTALIYFLLLIAYFIYILIKYDREYKTDFDHKYNREFIDDYDVEVIDYLMSKSITPNAMSASIMNLIYKKKINATPLEKNDFSLELISREGVSTSESSLISFLFDTVAKGNVLTLSALKKFAKSQTNYSKFTSSYEKWKNTVVAAGIKQNFYENNISVKIKGVLYGVLGIFISLFSIIFIDDFAWSHLVLIPAILFIIYVCAFRKKTLKGINHYKRWIAFKNFLNDFGSFEDKNLPEVVLWERYLVYAVIFGLANKVQKAMNVKIKEMELNGVDTTMVDMIHLHSHLNMSHIINSSISTAVNNAVTAAAAHSSSSSGSGHGGGFSSGGGFGGGGGGGHGF